MNMYNANFPAFLCLNLKRVVVLGFKFNCQNGKLLLIVVL
jgi:hypothetical protein